ncbi:MAG: TolC family protein [Myxococcota bacterium]
MLLALFLSTSASAADLDAFLDAATVNDPDIAAAAARYDRARAGVGVARSALLPSVSASAGYQRNFPPVEITLPGTDTTVNITPEDQILGQVRVNVPLLVPSAIAGTQAAAAQKRAEESAAELATEGALLSVVQSYWTVLSASRVERAAEEGLQAAATNLELARARAALDAASTLDVRRAEADEARARQTKIAAEAQRRDAERRLRTLTGLDDTPDAESRPRALPEGDLQALALDRNAEVRAAREALGAARLQGSQIAWTYAPTVAASATMNVTNATGFSGKPVTGNAGVTATWMLLDGGARESRWAQARAGIRESEARLEGLERSVSDRVAAAEDQVSANTASLEAARIGRDATAEALRLAEERFRLGDLDANQLTQARRDAFDAEVQAARAEAGLAIAVEQLRLLVGARLIDAG